MALYQGDEIEDQKLRIENYIPSKTLIGKRARISNKGQDTGCSTEKFAIDNRIISLRVLETC